MPLNDNNIVTEVITGVDRSEDDLPEGFDSWEDWYADFRGQTCKELHITQQVMNTLVKVQHIENYAGIGYTFDPKMMYFMLKTIFKVGSK